jgi:hypothetical protein
MRLDPSDPSNAHPTARDARPLTVRQLPGDALFVPSLWYHQVENATDCVSINHNWFNASNARTCWAALKDEVTAVRDGLSDEDDRADGVLVQELVRRRAGVDVVG